MLIVENNILFEINNWLSNQQYSNIFILVDENTKEFCLPLLGLEKKYTSIEIVSGEINKNLDSCQIIWKSLLDNNADRKALLINLGGGVICDMGGFCASTYKRGIDFINIPTTLLAQVDASIGGKTAIDFENQKNMIGLFSEAKATFIDSNFLASLPKRQLMSGFAEVLKHGLIEDKNYFEKCIDTYLYDEVHWNKIIDQSIQIKSNIVQRDPTEKGIRKILNFGHTIGHAIETYSLNHHKKPLLHGEAVIIGIVGELFLSMKEHFISSETLNKTIAMLKAVYIDLKLEAFNFNEVMQFMINDKKTQNGEIKCILLEQIGNADFDYSISSKNMKDALLFIIQKFPNA